MDIAASEEFELGLAGRRGRANEGGWRKRKGEMTELLFMEKAMGMGLQVLKPWGDSNRYDFLVEGGRRFSRVQVKSAYHELKDGGYVIRAHGAASSHVYTEDEIDVLAAYVGPVKAWYLFPIEALRGVTGVKLFPVFRRQVSKHEKYREA